MSPETAGTFDVKDDELGLGAAYDVGDADGRGQHLDLEAVGAQRASKQQQLLGIII